MLVECAQGWVPIEKSGRYAVCFCGRKKPSSENLPFFEYSGPGSGQCESVCKTCRYYDVAHTEAPGPWNGHKFEPTGPDDFDIFYCGCRGWD